MTAPISNVKKMTLEELENATLSNICELGEFVSNINITAGECISGQREEIEFAAEITDNMRCILCTISSMVEAGDIDGLSRLKIAAVKEGGCGEFVSSN